jgi:hypothetical protein
MHPGNDLTDQHTDWAFCGLLRGMFFGTIAVFAVAVWAVNMGETLEGVGQPGVFAMILQFVLCDAVPLATLIAAFRMLGSDRSAEATLRSMLRAVFWFFGGFWIRGHADGEQERATTTQSP